MTGLRGGGVPLECPPTGGTRGQLGLPVHRSRHPDDPGHPEGHTRARSRPDDVRRVRRRGIPTSPRRTPTYQSIRRLWRRTFTDPPATEQLIAARWGYATISPASIQADHGAGLTRGIIGLVNRGQPRKPDDWGTLRAWAWGAARGLDYLGTTRPWTPPRWASRCLALRQSRLGDPGLRTPLRHRPRGVWGPVEPSCTAGAPVKRSRTSPARVSTIGWRAITSRMARPNPASAAGMPGICPSIPINSSRSRGPRPAFISYGIPEGGCELAGSARQAMAVVAAGPAYRLLGARDLGVTEDHRTASACNTGFLDGELAWRQHDGGRDEDRTNMKHFIAWVVGNSRNWLGRPTP